MKAVSLKEMFKNEQKPLSVDDGVVWLNFWASTVYFSTVWAFVWVCVSTWSNMCSSCLQLSFFCPSVIFSLWWTNVSPAVCCSGVTSTRPLGVSVCKQETYEEPELGSVCVRVCLRRYVKLSEQSEGKFQPVHWFSTGPFQGHCDVSVCIIIAFYCLQLLIQHNTMTSNPIDPCGDMICSVSK